LNGRCGRGRKTLLVVEDFSDEHDEDVLAIYGYRDFNSRSVTLNSTVMARQGRLLPEGGFVDPFARTGSTG